VDLAAGWLLFPLVLAATSFGLGLLVDRISGEVLPPALILPVGLAGLMVVARFVTALSQTAPLALPAILVLAVAGFASSRARLRAARPDRLALLAAVGVFCVYGAPLVLSGHPTFAGYTLLGDTGHQLSLASFFPRHGPDWGVLPQSSYRLALYNYIVTAYPVAGQALIGVLAPLAFLDYAWLYQPFFAFVGAAMALGLYALVAPWVPDRRMRALVAFAAAQSALAVSFALQGSIKEVTGAAMLVVTSAAVSRAIAERWPARSLAPVAVAAAATVGALGPTAAGYLAPLLGVFVVVWLWRTVRRPARSELAAAAVVLVLGVVSILPVLSHASTAYKVNDATLSMKHDLGNLAAPLKPVQVSGVWLNGDYRYRPARHRSVNYAVTVIALAAAALGAAWALRRRALGPLLLLGGVGIASLYLFRRGSPYADAKIMMVLSPAMLLSAMLGGVALRDMGQRAIGLALAVVLAGAVLASNALAYHDAQLAPFPRFDELLRIDHRLDGKGPALVTEYDELSQYFLRDADPYSQPEWPHGYRVSDGYRGSGLGDPERRPSIKTPLDLDDLTTKYVQSIGTIVIRRSPTVSRPPSNYRRTFAGRYYEVWQRRPGTRGTVVRHVPLGRNVFEPAGRPRCGDVRRLSREARRLHGRLAYVPRPRLSATLPLEMVAVHQPIPGGHPPGRVTRVNAAAPAGWFAYAAYPGGIVPTGQGRLDATVDLPAGGPFRLWLEGSFGRSVSVEIDGRSAGQVSHEQGNPGQYLRLSTVALRPGRHRLVIRQSGGGLAPGNGGSDSSLRHIGPVVFSPPLNERPAGQWVSPARAGFLCDRSLDWIELVVPRRAAGAA
jgi:hypothetical protein